MFDLDALSMTDRDDFVDALKPRPREEPPARPKANAIKRGEIGEIPRVAEDASALIGRIQECFVGLRPQNGFHGWLIDQIAATTLRLDRLGWADRRMRDRVVMRAEACWDEDQMALTEAIGARIAGTPTMVVCQLRSSPHGCDWLIRRWALLGQAARGGAGWTAEQVALAHDLLKTPAGARDGAPGQTFGGADGLEAIVPDRVELARREIADLRGRKAEVLPQDAIDRAMVEADYAIEPTPELRRLGRHEASLRGWLRWLVGQVRQAPPDRNSRADLYPELPEVAPEARPDAPVEAEAGPKAEGEAAAEEGAGGANAAPLPRLASSTRRDPQVGRGKARRDASRRKGDRRRA